MSKPSYAIITPAYNEAEFLPKVIDSIVTQDLRPLKWLIVDDRSHDNTWSIINEASKTHPFIEAIRLTGSQDRKVGANVVRVFEEGLRKLTVDVDFLVKMDADVALPRNYFSQIMDHFKRDPLLGMASGKTYNRQGSSWVLERSPDFHVYGPCKTYRTSCFEDIDGLIPLLGWDILDGTKARMKGWKTRSFRDLPIYHLRMMGSAKGMFRGRMRTGRVMYTIRAQPLFVLGKSLFRAIEKPYMSGLLIPFGYFASFVTRPERLADMELAHFLRREQMGRLFGRTLDQEELIPRRLGG